MPDRHRLIGGEINLRLCREEAPNLVLGAELAGEVLLVHKDVGGALGPVLIVYDLNLIHNNNYKILIRTNGIINQLIRIQSSLIETLQKAIK